MEALSCIFSKAEEAGIFKGIQTPNEGPVLSHLFMPGDALILDEWSKENVVEVGEVSTMAKVLGCKREEGPLTYLGITVNANMN
ncbi:hypothetical protein HanPI659440_Chr12g0474581 [Helianthus annuus]|nr:hypothetical protein HanPI659440_Chr12g0474581 [Helianthus annuus]